jgi:hypothetical protein
VVAISAAGPRSEPAYPVMGGMWLVSCRTGWSELSSALLSQQSLHLLVMTDEAHAHAVVGWLALVLQDADHGMLNAAERIAYDIVDDRRRAQYRLRVGDWSGPLVSVRWVGGPLAQVVAEKLAAASAPAFSPIEVAASPTAADPTHATVTIGPVRVMLAVTEPNPRATARTWGETVRWQWPNPIQQGGTACSEVIWLGRPDQTTGSAVVVHTPYAQLHDIYTYGVVDSSFDGRIEWGPLNAGPPREADAEANVRLRTADPGWGREDAARWAEMAPHYIPEHGPDADIAAVRLPPSDGSAAGCTVYLRVFRGPDAPGLEIMADLVGHRWVNAGYEPGQLTDGVVSERVVAYAWASVASVVLSAATTSTRLVPHELWVRPVGLSSVETLFRLTINETMPLDR